MGRSPQAPGGWTPEAAEGGRAGHRAPPSRKPPVACVAAAAPRERGGRASWAGGPQQLSSEPRPLPLPWTQPPGPPGRANQKAATWACPSSGSQGSLLPSQLGCGRTSRPSLNQWRWLTGIQLPGTLQDPEVGGPPSERCRSRSQRHRDPPSRAPGGIWEPATAAGCGRAAAWVLPCSPRCPDARLLLGWDTPPGTAGGRDPATAQASATRPQAAV